MENETSKALLEVRQKIDDIDQELISLFNERARCALKVGEIKLKESDEAGAIFYRPEREAQVLRKVMDLNPGPLSEKDVALLFRELMSVCLAMEHPLKVAYLGPEGTFTQSAALKHFGHGVEATSLGAIDEVFREVAAGADYGVVPVENSTEGMVNHTLDNLIDSSLKICGEVELKIHHHFLLKNGSDTKKVKRIYSHQQSLAQCRKWLDANWPDVERVAVSSNAEAARLAAKEKNAAAIAGDIAAEIYDLEMCHSNIEDNPNNVTRFLVIGHEEVEPSGDDKTSFVVSTRNKPGALYQLLAPFHKENISLTRIETRPARDGSWAYVFFVDFEGHQAEEPARSVLRELENEVVELRRLGSYPKAVL